MTLGKNEELRMNEEEEQVTEWLLRVNYWIQHSDKWGLEYNNDEVTHAIHTIQHFITMHMLQRLDAYQFGHWYREAE